MDFSRVRLTVGSMMEKYAMSIFRYYDCNILDMKGKSHSLDWRSRVY